MREMVGEKSLEFIRTEISFYLFVNGVQCKHQRKYTAIGTRQNKAGLGYRDERKQQKRAFATLAGELPLGR